jgi:transposase
MLTYNRPATSDLAAVCRAATRYDKLAPNFASAVALASVVAF